MRIVYMGSGTFSVPALRALLASRHEVVGVYTQPARPAGRKGALTPTPVARGMVEAGLEATPCADINAPDVVARVRALAPDVICVADFGQMIGQDVLGCARHGGVNLHGSLLPELRGAAPVNWALIRGYQRTGVTTLQVVEKMDAGAVYLTAATDIGPEETAEELKARLAAMGAEVLCETLGLIEGGWAEPREQDAERVTFARRLKKSDGVLDWSAGAESLHNRIRGTWPWPGGQAVLDLSGRQMPVTIAASRVEAGASSGPPGTLDEALCVATGSGRIRIVRIRPAGKRLMEWEDFVHGYRPRPGDRFGGPEKP